MKNHTHFEIYLRVGERRRKKKENEKEK